ncbi:hypothetical protein [Hydrogenophaga sp.]|uniref:hypothetical protein n=1 Tax=Hydrogenophaga sp. TaxID=1904254 RepID=UPI00286D77AC|nr:hypothetical protein [Hydrogenophaga sp.]
MKPIPHPLWRLWQPRSQLFWLVLLVNALSAVLVAYLRVAQPDGAVRWAVSLLALTDTLLGWWLLRRLWLDGATPIAGPNT